MNREIKFRVFDKVTKRMGISFYPLSLEGADQLSNTLTGIHNIRAKSISQLVFMQYTGLKDKNGKEIYEGDMLKSKESDEVWRVDEMLPAHRHDHVTNIGYFDGKKYHSRTNPAAQYHNQDDWMSWPEMYEIIGNIYENPELLSPNELNK